MSSDLSVLSGMVETATYLVGIDESGNNIPSARDTYCMAAVIIPSDHLDSVACLVEQIRKLLNKPKRDPKYNNVRRYPECRRTLLHWLDDNKNHIKLACMHAEADWFRHAEFHRTGEVARQVNASQHEVVALFRDAMPRMMMQKAYNPSATMPLFVEQLLYPVTLLAKQNKSTVRLLLDRRNDVTEFQQWIDNLNTPEQGRYPVHLFYPEVIQSVDEATAKNRPLTILADWIVGDIRQFFKQWGESAIYPLFAGSKNLPPALRGQRCVSVTAKPPFIEFGPFNAIFNSSRDRVNLDKIPLFPAYGACMVCNRASFGMDDGYVRVIRLEADGTWFISTNTVAGMHPDLAIPAIELLYPPASGTNNSSSENE
ncbi:MAG: hypothetical protein IT445_02870 [Phycisphaeraceae bacterium]|nr:hypothetical protein [Phycisphaeraceae bacterium]